MWKEIIYHNFMVRVKQSKKTVVPGLTDPEDEGTKSFEITVTI